MNKEKKGSVTIEPEPTDIIELEKGHNSKSAADTEGKSYFDRRDSSVSAIGSERHYLSR